MSTPLNITADRFEKEVLASPVPVLVDFWAPWCPPCKAMIPVLDELAADLGDKAKIVKIDVDAPENQQLAMMFQIRSIPTMKVFKKGQAVAEFVGMRSKQDLAQALA